MRNDPSPAPSMHEPVRHPPPDHGLSVTEAQDRLARDGANELPGNRHMGLALGALLMLGFAMFARLGWRPARTRAAQADRGMPP